MPHRRGGPAPRPTPAGRPTPPRCSAPAAAPPPAPRRLAPPPRAPACGRPPPASASVPASSPLRPSALPGAAQRSWVGGRPRPASLRPAPEELGGGATHQNQGTRRRGQFRSGSARPAALASSYRELHRWGGAGRRGEAAPCGGAGREPVGLRSPVRMGPRAPPGGRPGRPRPVAKAPTQHHPSTRGEVHALGGVEDDGLHALRQRRRGWVKMAGAEDDPVLRAVCRCSRSAPPRPMVAERTPERSDRHPTRPARPVRRRVPTPTGARSLRRGA